MLFSSYSFLLAFLPLTLAGFYACGKVLGPSKAKLFLLAASCLFYAVWDWRFLGLLFVSVGVNYGLGRRLTMRPSRLWLAAGIGFNLLLLGYFKYMGFFVENLAALLGTDWSFRVVLPLGISFFTFQKIAYLADSHQGRTPPHSFLDFSLFVFFFPQLIAGPIVHPRELMPQFGREGLARFDGANFLPGLLLLGVGLLKKAVIADSLAVHADQVFAAAAAFKPLQSAGAFSGVAAYALQLYFDFSGYADMAVGLALMLNLELPFNFNSPYRSSSIIDFWRRWHMSLSRFLRDYVYIPLGGKYSAGWRRYRNLFATAFAAGVWHGAAWTFVVWGAWHGAGICVNHFTRERLRWTLPAWLAWPLLMAFVLAGWALFRADSLASAAHLLGSVARGDGLGVDPWLWGWIAAALLLALLPYNSGHLLEKWRAGDRRWTAATAACLGFLLPLLLSRLASPMKFLYFQF